jgi:S1-C subfamily serine protease
MLSGGKAERPWLGLTLSETTAEPPRAEILYVAPFTPSWEQKFAEGDIIERVNGVSVSAVQGALIPAIQDILFPTRPGELVSLDLVSAQGARSRRVLMSTPRPEFPLAQAAEKDSKERMAAPLFGLVLSPAGGTGLSPNFLVKKVVRGSTADEAGLSEQDPVLIRNFRVEKNAGVAIMEITVKKRRMGYLETSLRLPAALDSPDTL